MDKKNEQHSKDSVVLIEQESKQERGNRTLMEWDDFKRSVRAKFSRLSDEDLESTHRRKEALIARIFEKYPDDLETREQITEDLADISRRYPSIK